MPLPRVFNYPPQLKFASESTKAWMRLGCLSLRDTVSSCPYLPLRSPRNTRDNPNEADAPVLS